MFAIGKELGRPKLQVDPVILAWSSFFDPASMMMSFEAGEVEIREENDDGSLDGRSVGIGVGSRDGRRVGRSVGAAAVEPGSELGFTSMYETMGCSITPVNDISNLPSLFAGTV